MVVRGSRPCLRSRNRARREAPQLELVYTGPPTWGGARPGAGRKPGPKGSRKVRHRVRRDFAGARHPLHVTIRILEEVGNVRRMDVAKWVRQTLRRSGHKPFFRIIHFTIQDNHLHVICEADDRKALGRGLQGFNSLLARRINQVKGRRGQCLADRYHVEILDNPTKVRNALSYVLNNWRRHRCDTKRFAIDLFSSGRYFVPWIEAGHVRGRPAWDDGQNPCAPPRTWMLREGWRKVGPISPWEVPGPRD